MDIVEATTRYETWTEQGLPMPPGVDSAAIDFKHAAMKDADSAFPFLRATFYRWAQRWLAEAGGLGDAPRVLAVGDLHFENFGTWRDANDRWIWGINDFDEAWELPWTSDLVRLCVSASLVTAQAGFELTPEEVCQLVLDGYREGMKEPAGSPFDLNSGNERLLKMAKKAAKIEAKFWAEFDDAGSKWKTIAEPPAGAKLALEAALPQGAKVESFREQRGPYDGKENKPSGLGSLGRARYCVLARDGGRRIVREAKVLLSSAVAWAAEIENAGTQIGTLLENARRRPDPCFQVLSQWAARRIAPDAVKISVTKLQKDGFAREDQEELFRAMGCETANIHLGSGNAAEVVADIKERRERDADWFSKAVSNWRSKVEEDWARFRTG